MVKIGPVPDPITECTEPCIFTCNDWPIFVDNNPNTATEISVTTPTPNGPPPRMPTGVNENAESFVVAKGEGTNRMILEKILLANGHRLDGDAEISGIKIYSINGELLFETQKIQGNTDELSAFADKLNVGVYFIETLSKTSKKVVKIIITN